jgi:hypothetical protein
MTETVCEPPRPVFGPVLATYAWLPSGVIAIPCSGRAQQTTTGHIGHAKSPFAGSDEVSARSSQGGPAPRAARAS